MYIHIKKNTRSQ